MKSISKPKTKPFDLYGSMRVPFDVATWLRGHKFSVEAVAVTRHLQTVDALETELAAVQKKIDAANDALAASIRTARAKMENSNGV